MSTDHLVTDAAVDAVAREMRAQYMLFRDCDPVVVSPEIRAGVLAELRAEWSDEACVKDHQREEWCNRARPIVEAAAPLIAAAALNAAAEKLHTEPYEKFTHQPHPIHGLHEAALVSGGIDSAAVWLRAHAADQYEREGGQ